MKVMLLKVSATLVLVTGVTSRATKPTGGDLCNECKAKTKAKNCRT